ncbi:hypothetical protein Bca4012_004003 [Brassica carinata]
MVSLKRKTRRPTHWGPYIDSVASQKPTNQTISFLSGLSYFHRLSPVCLSTLLLPNLLLLRQTLNINICVRFQTKTARLREGVFQTPCDDDEITAAWLAPKDVPPQKMSCVVVHIAVVYGQVVKQNIATMVLEREGNDRRVSQSSYSLARHRGRLWKDGCLWARSMVVAFILKHGSALEAPREELEAQKITMILDQVREREREDENYSLPHFTDERNPEAVIFVAATGRHALVYDINAINETWEWVDLKEIPPEDIRWDEKRIVGVALNTGPGSGSIRGNRRNQGHIGRGRGPRIHQPRREFLPPPTQQNGGGGGDDIELFNTDLLVKEVERVFDATHPDPFELDKAKKMLKEHEQALMAALARLADTSDGEIET